VEYALVVLLLAVVMLVAIQVLGGGTSDSLSRAASSIRR
jgi:Flp pilus assembly pilin Flp